MALASIGEYKRAEEAHLKSIQLDQNFLEAWIHLTQVSVTNVPCFSVEAWNFEPQKNADYFSILLPVITTHN